MSAQLSEGDWGTPWATLTSHLLDIDMCSGESSACRRQDSGGRHTLGYSKGYDDTEYGQDFGDARTNVGAAIQVAVQALVKQCH